VKALELFLAQLRIFAGILVSLAALLTPVDGLLKSLVKFHVDVSPPRKKQGFS
jgi:hypothetical protein